MRPTTPRTLTATATHPECEPDLVGATLHTAVSMPLCIDTMDRSPLHAYYKRRPARIARCTVTAISAVALGGIAIAVLVARAYDWHHYTFWALIIGAATTAVVAVAAMLLPTQWRRTVVATLLVPTTAMAWTVFLYSAVMISINGDIFTRTTSLGGGSLTVGAAHTGDLLIHTLPAVTALVLLALYWQDLVSAAGSHGALPIVVVAWWIVAPFIPLLIYASFNDPSVEYPSDLDHALTTYVVSLVSVGTSVGVFVMARMMRDWGE